MKKFISNRYTSALVGIFLILSIWFVISNNIEESIMIFPNPILVFKETIKILQSSYIYKCIGYSFYRILIGFSIAFILGLFFGVLCGNNRFLFGVFAPFITVLKAIPTATLVFFFLVLVGAKNSPILMVIIISFPIIYESICSGIQNIDKDLKDNIELDGGFTVGNIFKLQLPIISKNILLGVANSFALSFKIEIMAEILAGNTKLGLGSAILSAQITDQANMIPIFAYSLITIIFVLLITFVSKIVNEKLIKE